MRAQVVISISMAAWAIWLARKGWQADPPRWLAPDWGACAIIVILLALIWFV